MLLILFYILAKQIKNPVSVAEINKVPEAVKESVREKPNEQCKEQKTARKRPAKRQKKKSKESHETATPKQILRPMRLTLLQKVCL